jgi:hypothetical protein
MCCQHLELVDEEGAIDCLAAWFYGDRVQWTLERSRKTDAVKSIIEARTIGMERQPDPGSSWLGTLEGVRALTVHVEMKCLLTSKKPLPRPNM